VFEAEDMYLEEHKDVLCRIRRSAGGVGGGSRQRQRRRRTNSQSDHDIKASPSHSHVSASYVQTLRISTRRFIGHLPLTRVGRAFPYHVLDLHSN